LQRGLAVYGDKIGYAADLAGALDNLSHGPTGVSVASGATTQGPSPSASPSSPSSTTPTSPTSPKPSSTPSSSTPPNAQAILTQLNTAFERLQDAYKSGDLAKIGQAQAEVQRLTQQYLNLINKSTSPGTSPSPTPTR
jgi:uncharacterized membrane protein (UPF0182 family)